MIITKWIARVSPTFLQRLFEEHMEWFIDEIVCNFARNVLREHVHDNVQGEVHKLVIGAITDRFNNVKVWRNHWTFIEHLHLHTHLAGYKNLTNYKTLLNSFWNYLRSQTRLKLFSFVVIPAGTCTCTPAPPRRSSRHLQRSWRKLCWNPAIPRSWWVSQHRPSKPRWSWRGRRRPRSKD